MWLFTKYGFYSVVEDRFNKDKVMVRARSRQHLVALQNLNAVSLKGCKIARTDSADYRFRMRMTKSQWRLCHERLVETLTYRNYKDEAKKLRDKDFDLALGEIWAIMHEYQERIDVLPHNVQSKGMGD